MSHQIISKPYNVRGKMITIMEFDGKPWITWASLKDLASFPSTASMSVIESTIQGGLGKGLVKTKVPKSDGNMCQGWLLSMAAVSTLLTARFDGDDQLMIDEIESCFDLFKVEKDLPSSGEEETKSNSSPQANDEEAKPSPEQEVDYPDNPEDVCKMIDQHMEDLVSVWSSALSKANKRIDELEMVKYADQLGSMAERISTMEEKLYGYEAELRDFKLVIRSLKEATGSQVQAETIAKLVGMVEKSQTLS